MIVTCPNCQTRYNLPEDKVPPGGAKVKCSKCAHVFKVDPPSTPEEEVETLLDAETGAGDTSAGDAFEETFDEVAATGKEPVGGPDEAEEPGEAEADDGRPAGEPGMDDLFADDEGAADTPSGGDGDVDSLFSDADDLFADDGEEEAEEKASGQADRGGADDLFAEDADDADDLFADDDEDDGTGAADDVVAAEADAGDGPMAGDLDLDLDEGADEKSVRSRRSLGCLIVLLIVVLLLVGAVWLKAWRWFGLDLCSYVGNVPYVGKLCLDETGDKAAPGESPADRVRNIVLKNVKQYYVANEKTGNLFVVEGKAVNQFAKPKERIKVEVVLYDGTSNVLASQSFLCGNVLSQFQLQVQTRAEIEEGLKSEVGILSNNTFIRPGASTPFMAVFFEPPAGVKEFLVKVVDVGDPK